MSFQENLDVFLAKQAKIKKITLLLSFIISTPAWIAIFIINWKIALCLYIIMFANNLFIKS